MKYCLLIITMVFFQFVNVYSQTAAETLSNKIAQRMKDSLLLSDTQKNQIYLTNMLIHDQKTAARQQYANSDSLTTKIQRAENKRDSLYHLVLTDEQFLLYSEKKKNLVNNN